jgi:hypothetical protein
VPAAMFWIAVWAHTQVQLEVWPWQNGLSFLLLVASKMFSESSRLAITLGTLQVSHWWVFTTGARGRYSRQNCALRPGPVGQNGMVSSAGRRTVGPNCLRTTCQSDI